MTRAHRFSYAVSFDDVDAAGLLYYPRYFHLCHLAFEDLFNCHYKVNYPTLIQSQRVGFPTVHVDADFKRPLHYGDAIVIGLSVDSIKTSSMTTKYRFNDADGETFVATITTVYTDLVTKRAQPLPSDVRAFLSEEKSQ